MPPGHEKLKFSLMDNDLFKFNLFRFLKFEGSLPGDRLEIGLSPVLVEGG